jgi:thiamine pyrophosphokinase
MSTHTFSILLAGDLVVTDRVRGLVAGSRVIAADGGIAHAGALGVEPEVWIGDFDSSDAALQVRFAHVERQAHPVGKDATDGELAVDEALRRGAERLVLAGGFGGRSDHLMQHMAHVVALAERGVKLVMTSGVEEAHPVLAGKTVVDVPEGSTFSIIPFGDLGGLSLGNVDWPLAARDVPFGSSLTMSNVARGRIEVGLARGRAVLIVAVSAG